MAEIPNSPEKPPQNSLGTLIKNAWKNRPKFTPTLTDAQKEEASRRLKLEEGNRIKAIKLKEAERMKATMEARKKVNSLPSK